MTPTRTLMLSSAIALIAASPALADLTAEQVLADQLRQMELYGMTAKVTNQSSSPGQIVVEEISASADVPEGQFRFTMGGATFTEQSDGTVQITYPENIPMLISGTSSDGEDFAMEMSLSQSNTLAVASGIPEEIRYEFSSDVFSLDDVKFIEPAEAAELDMDVSFQIVGMSGVMEMFGGGSVRDYTANFAFEAVNGLIGGMADGEGSFNLAFDVSSVVADYTGTAAPQELMGSLADAIQAGTKTDGSASHGPLTYSVSGDGPDGTFEIAAAVASGKFDFKMDRAGLDYETVSRDMTLSVGGSVIPLPPLTFKMAESGGRFAMPVVPSEDEQDFALRMNLEGLEIDQMLWGMIDPVGQIPRDPASLIVDLAGSVTMTEDIFAPEFAESASVPGQINSLAVKQILLTLAGAELTGDGDMSFDNSGPVPMPAGVMNMMLKGGNKLLDTLVGMGLIPEEQAMGARMMTGLFARPGTGPDTLVSTIEFNEDGSILANGQRIK